MTGPPKADEETFSIAPGVEFTVELDDGSAWAASTFRVSVTGLACGAVVSEGVVANVEATGCDGVVARAAVLAESGFDASAGGDETTTAPAGVLDGAPTSPAPRASRLDWDPTAWGALVFDGAVDEPSVASTRGGRSKVNEACDVALSSLEVTPDPPVPPFESGVTVREVASATLEAAPVAALVIFEPRVGEAA